ncbi:hypothetical protein CMI37_13485 [Candidatus Pacearchaeota archaeon]|nr:hypothetical protein [Candidatus Pacearchaeota archaeon]|tara:strand:+ start:2774 stop:2980 length:207 start_codon:yes stop_codon:yes gene_type:complete
MKNLFIILIILITVGCKCWQCEPAFPPKTIDEIAPEEKYKLLHIAEQWAYRSVTRKDFEIEEFCSTEG